MAIHPEWITGGPIYHIYPLGFCGCERRRSDLPADHRPHRITKVLEWISHIKNMHVTAVYFGPVFESAAHGYDTTDYKLIDARLGTNEDFAKVCKALHNNGIRVILDGVFNHVGREHFAFRDVCENRERSRYCGWFCSLDFGGNTGYNDGFRYEGWNNCYDLVKLNLQNPEVNEYLLSAVKFWIDEWDIDGIRFDAADCLTEDFIKSVHSFARSLKPDIWLMGEIIHGQYNRWANPDMFDCVTNYQCYKGIYSSHNDRNYFEIAHSIEYQTGQYGDIYMYNFLDNHDVARLASVLTDYGRIYCCYTFLYTMYGIPSVYYGSEYGIKGEKGRGSDADLAIRPCLELDDIPGRDDRLYEHICSLGAIRAELPALRTGRYFKLELKNQTFLFKREGEGQTVYIALNISDGDYTFNFDTPYKRIADRLSGRSFDVHNGRASVTVGKDRSMILVDAATTVHETVHTEETAVPDTSKNEAISAAPAPAGESAPEKPAQSPKAAEPPKSPQRVSYGIPDGRMLVIGGRYRHFKGGEYIVTGTASDHETLEPMCIYLQINDKPRAWVRPIKEFLDDIDDNGCRKPRFEFIERAY